MRLGPVEMQPRDVDRKPRHAILVLGEQRGESGRVERIDRAPVGLGHRGSFGRAGRRRASPIPAVGALPPETARLTPRRAPRKASIMAAPTPATTPPPPPKP